MKPTCEVCGSTINTSPNRVEIDGAVLQVCQTCAKHGTPLSTPVKKARPSRPYSPVKEGPGEVDLEVDPEYNSIVRQARERMGLTQEALGRAINVKPSVISHVESKKLKPDMVLAKTLMHYLKVQLLVSSSELESETGFEESRR